MMNDECGMMSENRKAGFALIHHSSFLIPHSSFPFQLLAVDLAAVVFGKRGDELDPARVLVKPGRSRRSGR